MCVCVCAEDARGWAGAAAGGWSSSRSLGLMCDSLDLVEKSGWVGVWSSYREGDVVIAGVER